MSDMRVAAILPCLAAALAASPSRAQEDEGPLRVRPSAEMAQPVLRCSPVELSAVLTRGETRRLRLTIRNAGGRVLKWLVTYSPSWAQLTRDSGELGYQKEQVVYVTIDTTALPAGRTRGRIVVEAAGAARSPATVTVAVEMLRPREERAPEPVEREPVKPKAPARRPKPKRSKPLWSGPEKELAWNFGGTVAKGPETLSFGVGGEIPVQSAWGTVRLGVSYSISLDDNDQTYFSGKSLGLALSADYRHYISRPSQNLYVYAGMGYYDRNIAWKMGGLPTETGEEAGSCHVKDTALRLGAGFRRFQSVRGGRGYATFDASAGVSIDLDGEDTVTIHVPPDSGRDAEYTTSDPGLMIQLTFGYYR